MTSDNKLEWFYELKQAQRTITKISRKVSKEMEYPWIDLTLDKLDRHFGMEDALSLYEDDLEVFSLFGEKHVRIHDGFYFDIFEWRKSMSLDLSLKVKAALNNKEFQRELSNHIQNLFESGELCLCAHKNKKQMSKVIKKNLTGLVEWVREIQYNKCYSNQCVLDEIELIILKTE